MITVFHHTIFRILLGGILLTIGISSGCHSRRTISKKDFSTEVVEAENKLLKATQQLLEVSDSENLEKRLQYRRLFETALAEYLLATSSPDTLTAIQFERDGQNYVLPIQLLTETGLEDGRGKFISRLDTLSAPLRGEILDLAWTSPRKNPARQLLALFADSLVSFTLTEGSYLKQKVFPFLPEEIRAIRSPYPTGALVVRRDTVAKDASPEIIVLTSSLQNPLIFQQSGDSLLRVDSLVPEAAITLPAAWNIPSGQREFRTGESSLSPFYGMRLLEKDSLAVFLDDRGRLNLATSLNFEILWTSGTPVGDRLFVVDGDRIIVSSSRRKSFVVYRVKDRQLELRGQTPPLRGMVSAVAYDRINQADGYLVSVTTRGSDRLPYSGLVFLGNYAFRLLPLSFPEPLRFPNYYEKTTLVQERRSLSDNGDIYPPAVYKNVFEGLFFIGADGRPAPLVAKRIRPDTAYQRWVIHLKPAVRFSDGTLLTAREVLESWQYLWRNDRRARGEQRWLWRDIRGAEDYANRRSAELPGLQVLDDLTLQIDLDRPRPNFSEHLTQSCFAIFKFGEDQTHRLGTGSFRIVRTRNRAGTLFINCVRNDHYHGGRPLLREIDFSFSDEKITDALSPFSEAVRLVQRDKDLAYFQQIRGNVLRNFPVPSLYFLALNPASEMLKDRRSRQQIAATLDREVLADIITEARCEAAPAFFSGKGLTLTAPAESPTFERELNIVFRARDGVAQQIAHRLAARLSQMDIPVQPARGLSDGEFEQLRRSREFDILVDAFKPTLGSPLYNLAQLLNHDYYLGTALAAELEESLATFSNHTVAWEERLIRQAILYPLVRAKHFAVLPTRLQDVHLWGTEYVDFSKAWIPGP